jgi:hypothetical protein
VGTIRYSLSSSSLGHLGRRPSRADRPRRMQGNRTFPLTGSPPESGILSPSDLTRRCPRCRGPRTPDRVPPSAMGGAGDRISDLLTCPMVEHLPYRCTDFVPIS